MAIVAGVCDEDPQADAPPPLPDDEAAEALDDSDPPPTAASDPSSPATQLHMHGRYGRVEGVRDALVVGDLVVAKRHAKGLETPLSPEEVPERVEGMRDVVPARSRTLRRASSLAQGARAFAQLMLACGQCHERAEVRWPWDAPALPEGNSLQQHMDRHAWAADRMWEGLMLGDVERFDSGARQLAEAPLTPEALQGTHEARVGALAQRVHRRARQAPRAKDMAERSAIYGDVLAACADCHTRARAPER